MKISKIVKVSFAALILSSVAYADAGELYKRCAGCHGSSGEKVALGKSKVINQMTKADFVGALKGYKDGSYGGAMKGLMKGQVGSLSDADIEALANHIVK